jgi:prephenate dehydrogenase
VTTSLNNRHFHVVGLGLIGGSIAKAIVEGGGVVTGFDFDPSVMERALSEGVISAPDTYSPEVIFIATPAATVGSAVALIDAEPRFRSSVMTDVAGIKGTIVKSITNSRFVGGHPMAGSELSGLDGARSDLFTNCTWVLTPTASTDPDSFSLISDIVQQIGAKVLVLEPTRHDELVALVSHVPHLLAGVLMSEAADLAHDDAAILRLAAGGFRDMTRVAAGDAAIWPAVLINNREAITSALSAIRRRLDQVEELIARADVSSLSAFLTAASLARRDLPGRGVGSSELVQLRLPVPDEPGVLAKITSVAHENNVNIFDIEISHTVEGDRGVLHLTIEASEADQLEGGLRSSGFVVLGETR